MDGRRSDKVRDLHPRDLACARDEVIEERATSKLSLRSVRDLFHEHGAGALGDPTRHLAFDDHRVDQDAAVLRDEVAKDLDGTRPGVDLYETDVGGVRVGGLHRVVSY